MNKFILTLAIVDAITGCKSQQSMLDEQRYEISWNAFCDARGYDRNDNTYLTVNEYFDTWCGSVEEEEALIAAGIEPY